MHDDDSDERNRWRRRRSGRRAPSLGFPSQFGGNRRRSLYGDVENTAWLIEDSDPLGPEPPRRGTSRPPDRLVTFPEDEPSDIILGESLPPSPGFSDPDTVPTRRARAARPSEMITVAPGPTSFDDPTVVARPRDVEPIPLPERAPRPGNVNRAIFGRRSPAPSAPPPGPGDVRGLVKTRERRDRRNRTYIWLAAWVFLIGLPTAVVALLIPSTWEWMVSPDLDWIPSVLSGGAP